MDGTPEMQEQFPVSTRCSRLATEQFRHTVSRTLKMPFFSIPRIAPTQIASDAFMRHQAA